MTAYEPSFFTQTFPAAIPAGAKPIDQLAAIAGDPKLLSGGARGVNLRMLAAQNPRIEARYALDLYLKERGDKKFHSVEDLYNTKAFAGENDWLRFALGERAETLATPEGVSHTLRITNLQRILYRVMADNNLDGLVYVYTTIPAPLVYPSRVAAQYDSRVEPRVLAAFRAQEDSLLTAYAWVEKDKGKVRIPIEEAMRIVAKRGLPKFDAPLPAGAAK
jgi:hypothetical protein